MVDALALGNGKSAQRLLHSLLENEDAFALWGMVIRQFRLLLLAREVIDQGGSPDDAARLLGGNPYPVKKAFEQARRFSMPVLEGIYHKLLDMDEQAKTGRVPSM